MPSKQIPLPSGFGPTSTTLDVMEGVDLRGKTAIVTGGYSGLGLETTRALAQAGATVIVPSRTPAKAAAALAGMPRVEHASLDLLERASIETFADAFIASGRPLHMLVNSAGIMVTPLARNAQGYESQFACNHLGHFQLTLRLWPALRAASGARVVSVSSRGHWLGDMDFDDPNYLERPYEKWQAYGQSKTANVLFALGLDRRGEASGIRAFSLHPGSIITDLKRHMSEDELVAFGLPRDVPYGFVPSGQAAGEGGDFKTIAQGAATAAWCATSRHLDGHGGVYCEDVDVAPVAADDSSERKGVRKWAIDPERAEQLWSLSERLTGVTFRG